MKALSRTSRNRYVGNKRGIAAIYVALILLVLVAFVGLAIDIGFMYVAKSQLQNAADAAALAGSARLTGEIDSSTSSFYQSDARQEAWTFACKNKAANQSVYLQTNSSLSCDSPPGAAELNATSNSDTGDLIVGNWNSTSQSFTRATGSTGLSINALLINARRTHDSPGGKVGIFFGRVFNFPTMAARASSIAVLTTPPFLALPICLPNCDRKTPVDAQWDFDKKENLDLSNKSPIFCTDSDASSSSPPGQKFYLNPSSDIEDPNIPGTSWTNFKISTCTSTCGSNNPTPLDMADIVTGKTKIPSLCNKRICNTNGDFATVLKKEMQDQYNNNKKEYTFQDITKTKTFKVEGWQVYLVIFSDTTCGGQSLKSSCPGDPLGNPYLIRRYTKVLISELITKGHMGYRIIALPRDAEPGNPITVQNFKQTVLCNGGRSGKTVTIDRWVTSFDCVPCEEVDTLFGGGTVSKLVK